MRNRVCIDTSWSFNLFLVLAWAAPGWAHPHEQRHKTEVYGFSISSSPTYLGYDWDVLTTVGWKAEPGLVATAHRHGARVELNAGRVVDVMFEPAARALWVQRQLTLARNVSADGINFDHEEPIAPRSEAAAAYTALVSETAAAFHAAIPGSTVSVDVPWSPYDIDNRSFDWLGLAEVADLLFVMVYDTQSQVFGRCVASANAPIDTVRRSVRQWLELGIPAGKLLLGLPWYAYDYPCEPTAGGVPPQHDTDLCALRSVPFRGVACSDAAGAQRDYWAVMELLRSGTNTTPVRWDEMQASPYFNYVGADDRVHQVWFDNPQSLGLKYQVAVDAGLRGLGVWNLDSLAYSSSSAAVQHETRAMWDAIAAAASRAAAASLHTVLR